MNDSVCKDLDLAYIGESCAVGVSYHENSLRQSNSKAKGRPHHHHHHHDVLHPCWRHRKNFHQVVVFAMGMVQAKPQLTHQSKTTSTKTCGLPNSHHDRFAPKHRPMTGQQLLEKFIIAAAASIHGRVASNRNWCGSGCSRITIGFAYVFQLFSRNPLN